MPDPSQFNIDRTYPGPWTITFAWRALRRPGLPPRVNRKPAYPVGRERGNAAVRYAATRSLISLNKMKNKPRQFRAGADHKVE
jgi:hypothetical protein